MHAQEVRLLHQWGLAHGKIEVRGVLQGVHHSLKPLRALRVQGAGPVVEHVEMGVEGDGHNLP